MNTKAHLKFEFSWQDFHYRPNSCLIQLTESIKIHLDMAI